MLGKKCNIKNDREYKTTSYRFVFFNILTNSIGLIVLFIQNGYTKGDLVLIKGLYLIIGMEFVRFIIKSIMVI
jgi:hypothetical protein